MEAAAVKSKDVGQTQKREFLDGRLDMDIVVPLVASDVATLRKNLDYIYRNLEGDRIVVIGSMAVKRELDGCPCDRVVFQDEDSIYPGMDLEAVRRLLVERGGVPRRAGWYLQQFLKIAYAYRCADEYYLTWDSDTAPIRRISMFENGRPVFDMKTEYHLPYFATIGKLFQGRIGKEQQGSFISEHMLFCTECVKRMAGEIESNTELRGKNFWEKILWAIDPADISGSGFSEFETYGNYICRVYPGQYDFREKKSLRAGAWFLGYDWTDEMMRWAAKDYATISFEKDSAAPKWLVKMDKIIGCSFLKYFIRLRWIEIIYIKLIGFDKK